jgi:hypothetical protein
MTDRDKLIEAGADALMNRMENALVTYEEMIGIVIDAVEPIIRADARERWRSTLPFTDKVKRNLWARDLRAQVEALPVGLDQENGLDVLWLSDVLALLEEASDD